MSPPPPPPPPPLLLHPRREPFEYGLLPIPKLIFTDPTTLTPIKHRLPRHVTTPLLAAALQIPADHAALILDTLASLHPAPAADVADSLDVILFLYLQSYKRLLPRSHKDSSSVADVWPSTSAFDGYLSALSPLQLVRSNSRRFMPSQADEEAHQLSYLHKHMFNILSLLAEPTEGEENLVLSLERFEHLSFLIQFGEGVPLSQVSPFFANSDPDMPAVPVPIGQIHEWVLEKIAASLEHTAEKVPAKDNGAVNGSDTDVTMSDACVSPKKIASGTSLSSNSPYSRNQTFVEGVSKASLVKHASDINGHSIKVLNCQDSVIYILAPLRYATVHGCSDTTIVLGAIGKALRVEHCERVQIITAAKRICIANCRECLFFLGVNQQPLILGDNHKLQVAPYNTFYSQLGEHMSQVGVDPSVNRWSEPLVLGMVDPHDSLSHPAGVSDVQAESAACLDPDQFTDFLIPSWFGVESPQPTRCNPFALPEIYMESQRRKHLVLGDIQQAIRNVALEEKKKQELALAIHVHFKDWLYASGNIRQLYCLQGD